VQGRGCQQGRVLSQCSCLPAPVAVVVVAPFLCLTDVILLSHRSVHPLVHMFVMTGKLISIWRIYSFSCQWNMTVEQHVVFPQHCSNKFKNSRKLHKVLQCKNDKIGVSGENACNADRGLTRKWPIPPFLGIFGGKKKVWLWVVRPILQVL
jgi:hypothetical protein